MEARVSAAAADEVEALETSWLALKEGAPGLEPESLRTKSKEVFTGPRTLMERPSNCTANSISSSAMEDGEGAWLMKIALKASRSRSSGRR